MNEQSFSYLTSEEKERIVSLVQSAGPRAKGVVISSIVDLHTWASVPNGFDARFLAKLYECKLQITSYSDPEMAEKLDRWVDWYKKTLNGKPLPEFPAPPVEIVKETADLNVRRAQVVNRDWSQKCEACGGHGTKQSRDSACEYCGGSGWMSAQQLEKYREYITVLKQKKDINDDQCISYAMNLLEKPHHKEEWEKSQVICTVCDGDGGAAGHCYKCGGSGWVLEK